MLPRLRLPLIAHRRLTRSITTSSIPPTPSSPSSTPVTPTTPDPSLSAIDPAEPPRHLQSPNRPTAWSRSQQPRALAMTGPRFENTSFAQQPAPHAAIELIHKHPVQFSEKRVVVCDGGGGPMGHPRIFINLDKPEVVPCGYCGVPFAHVHHRETLAREGMDYPLS